jgi:hypothetical protein
MFSLEKFYFILYANLLKHANIDDCYFYPFGSTNLKDLIFDVHEYNKGLPQSRLCFYYDQEPFDIDIAEHVYEKILTVGPDFIGLRILATGELSVEIDRWCEQYNYKNWYYFFHGFAALDWYRDYQYVPEIEKQFTQVFISFNRLVTKNRSYRLYFVSQLIKKDLLKHGHVSLILEDNGLGTWKEELADSNSLMSTKAKTLTYQQISTLTGSLIIDKENPPGHASADSGYHELMMYKSALWHVVTETVYYHEKLHLTEKIFKPIVAKRPFILLGAVNNLAYLKSYGFKTFDQWIDESYDREFDPDLRSEMVLSELEKLCCLSTDELNQMYVEMQDILEFNFNHFYGDFKKIIVEEMLTNFKSCVDGSNADTSDIKFEQVQQLLSQ